MPHVVVVGAGFAGVAVTRELAKRGFRVTVVDRHPYNTFQPLLYQVATGGLNAGDVTYSLRFLSAKNKANFRRTKVVGIDHDHNEVICDDGVRIPYDYLVLGTGITTNHFGIPGAAEYTMSMYTRAEALKVRDTIFGGLENIAGTSHPGTGGFTVVVVGGGPTGVEMAGSLAELKDSAIPTTYPELDPKKVHVVLVEMANALLLPFDEKLQRYTLSELVKRGVDVRLRTALSEVHPDHVVFKDGNRLDVDLVIWAAGVSGSKELNDWGVPIGRGGRIEVGTDCRVKGFDNVFAIGDVALITENPLPQLAQPAIQEGKFVARQIGRLVNGEDTEEFHYFDKGTMATIGNRAAVLQLPNGFKMTGTFAWLGWIVLHIAYLLGGRNRVQTLVNLAARYATWPRRAGAIVGDVNETPQQAKVKASKKKEQLSQRS
ncbi:NAD(P)/FAD-dependent oxidoreductase [Microlunatus kandeliicorticis]|nr:NAD(P)/FAD-dependent oxidoreductase [Microlunatus kandeliicorticis]